MPPPPVLLPDPPEDDDPEITDALSRLRDADPRVRDAARNTLLEYASRQFYRLASRMLDRYSRLRRFEQTGDVLNKALIRLGAALTKCSPEKPRHFCNLVAQQIRYALLDLVRSYFGPLGMGTHQDAGGLPGDDEGAGREPATGTAADPQTLVEWAELHEQIARLPEDQREVVDLFLFEGLSLQQIADLQGKSRDVVRYVFRAARESLRRWFRPAEDA